MTPDPTSATCPICDGVAGPYCSKLAYGQRWNVCRCAECGHGFIRNPPTLEQLREIYERDGHFPIGESTETALAAKRDCAELAQRVADAGGPRERVLDVGCGDGGFSWHLAQLGFGPFDLIDLDPRAAAAEAAVPDSTFRQCAFEDIAPDQPYSVIVMSQILEHALDPMDWLFRAEQLLHPDGVLAVALPNFAGVYRLLGERDPMIIPPVHLNYFTPRSIRRAMELAGLEALLVKSNSRVRVSAREKDLSARRVLAARAWNAVATGLNQTSLGIVLVALARPTRAAARRAA